jgi:hypothetical protein
MKITPLSSPLPGEHLAATSPVIRPETDDAHWRLRLDFWAGRALTAESLELEQENRAARLAWRGRFATPGVVSGLEVALESPATPPAALGLAGHFVHVFPGHGFLADGEDVVIPRPLRVPLDQIPVHYVRVGGPNVETPAEPPPAGAEAGAPYDAGELAFSVDRFPAGHLPWAAVLVLCPAEFRTFAGIDPEDPCELDASRDAFADERRLDACVLRLCQLPARWESLPELADRNDLRWRNRLAHVVFSEEALASSRQQIRFLEAQPAGQRWDTVSRPGDLFPWEWLGVPLALFSSERASDEAATGFFLDRATVVRPGGGAKARTRPALRLATADNEEALNPPGAGTPRTWRARVDQFAEHLGLFEASDETAITALASRFQFVPPAGFLPRGVLNFLTTAQALALPPAGDRPPDRAGINHFFPVPLEVEAVPVAIEDLDTALAASASLAAYDLTAANADDVRVLVPLPERVFDPQLLVVEREDPIFAATVARFVATRQDWRQRRDFVRGRRDVLQGLLTGAQPASPVPPLESGQLEPEPVETLTGLGILEALVSPITTRGLWEVSIEFDTSHEVSADALLFFWLRLDEDSMPSQIEARWRSGSEEFRFSWTQPPPAPPEQFDAEGRPLASPLWRRFSVTTAQLGVTSAVISGFTLHLDDGRVALAGVGQFAPEEEIWWRANFESPREFTGGDGVLIFGDQLFAPFEQLYEPVFPDGRSQDDRLEEVETALNPPGVTERTIEMTVADDGLQRVLAELEAEASEADDFVDAHFTRAQVNLYRIRKLILGETAAQKLLINPAIAAIAEQETATASAEQLGAFITAAKQRPPIPAADVNRVLRPVPATGAPPSRAAGVIQNFGAIPITFESLNPLVNITPREELTQNLAGLAFEQFDRSEAAERTGLKAGALKDVLGERPETGPTLPPRGLSIGQRFVEPKATQNLSYARSDLLQVLKQLPDVRLPLAGETVRALNGQDVSLLALQGRVIPPPPPPAPGVAQTSETIRQEAVTKLLDVQALTADTDEAEVTLAALDFTEIKSAILRTIERVIQQRRAIVLTGNETLGLIGAQRDAAAARVLAIEGRLVEARHDVSVARSLRQEEQQRVTAINDRRDGLIRDEVKFLAFVRPRAVDPTRRRLPYWRMEAFGVPAPVPACLQRHDEPPPALNAYIQLLRHAPARWFTALEPLLGRLDTPDKLVALLDATRVSAVSFNSLDAVGAVRGAPQAVQFTVLGAHQVISTLRQRSTQIEIGDKRTRRWTDFQRDAHEHASVGDLITGRHGSRDVSAAAAGELEQIGVVGTCLHAEFAAVPPVIRLAWIERFSQFDRPALLRDLTVLPQYARLDRQTRRRLQEFADWLFGRVSTSERDAVNLVNDLVRLCLLLASHAPVNRIIAGHVPRPTLVRPGIQIPIRPVIPELVRVGMEFHVWQASRVVATGRVEDLHGGEVSARVNHVEAQTTTIDTTMRVQFVPAALSFRT